MLFFRSEEHLDHWLRECGKPRGAILSLQQTWELSLAWYDDRRALAWKPRSVEESQAVLDKVGLTGPFWRL